MTVHRSSPGGNTGTANTATAATRLIAAGFQVCKPDRGGKSPTYPGWSAKPLPAESFNPGDMIGIMGGAWSDGGKPGHSLLIADFDTLATLELAPQYIGPTEMREGRPSKPDSHWYVLTPNDSIPEWAWSTAPQAAPAAKDATGHPGPFLKHFQDRETGKGVLDLIGTGGQVVAPPSVYENGERREWSGGQRGVPAVEDFEPFWFNLCRLAEALGCGPPSGVGWPWARPAPPRPDARRSGRADPGDVLRRVPAYLAKCSGAVAKQGGHRRTFAVACAVVHGFGVEPETALDLLASHYNPKCDPPWSERELRHKVQDAAKVTTHRKPYGHLRDTPPPRARSVYVGRPAEKGGRGAESNGDGHHADPPDDTPAGAPPAESEKVVNLTDVGNGYRFAADNGTDIRFVVGWGWAPWDGARWKRDDRHHAEALAKATVAKLFAEGAAEKQQADELLKATAEDDEQGQARGRAAVEAAKRKLTWALKSEDAKRITALLQMARSELAEPADRFDAHPWLLNCPNGTVDLRTSTLRPHDRADFLTQLCPTEYRPDATCPTWERFLAAIFAGDLDLVEFVRRCAGYWLTGATTEHVLPIIHGTGANGKSTFLETLLDLLGRDYAIKAPADLLLVRKHDQHPTEKADLRGRRLVVCVETDDGKRLAEGLVKELTGGDRVRARFMRQDFFEFVSTHKLVLASNHKPKVRGTDHAIWRRLALVPFGVKFWNPDVAETADEERDETLRADKDLKAKLLAERGGILAWLVRGCLDWQAGGLTRPRAVEAASREYRGEEDLVARFADEKLDFGPNLRVRANVLYGGFRGWCDAIGEAPMTQTAFGRAMLEHGVTKKQSNGTVYVGVDFRGMNDDH